MDGLELSNTCSETKFHENFHTLLTKLLSEKDITEKKVVLSKRIRDLHHGDYSIPKGSLSHLQSKVVEDLKHAVLDLSQKWPWPIRDVVVGEHYPLAFYLQRTQTFRNVLSTFWKLKWTDHMCERGTVIINNSDLHTSDSQCKKFTLEHFRSFVVMVHVAELLKANGYTVRFVNGTISTLQEEYLQLLNFDSSCFQKEENASDSIKELLLTTRTRSSELKAKESSVVLQTNSYRESTIKNKSGKDHEEENKFDECNRRVNKSEPNKKQKCDENESENTQQRKSYDLCHDKVSLDIKAFMIVNDICSGKGKYDKNLSTAIVEDANGPTQLLKQIAELQASSGKTPSSVTVLHIESDKNSFSQQKVDLTWRILTGNCPRQVHLVYGPVQSRKSASTSIDTAADFHRLRYEQMKEASVMKYGSQVQGAGWEETIQQLTVASIKFELLSSTCRNSVKLDLAQGNDFGGGIDNRAGAFVMYNCARLSKLFKHFEEAVKRGIYPPLPDIEEIDFSTLREEDEWSLFFLYIFPYMDLIGQTVEELCPPKGEIFSKISTHKMCNFLIGLSRKLSCYYSRTHVLVENRQHLLPTMYARIYLLKVVYKVMQHALTLMGIVPLTQL